MPELIVSVIEVETERHTGAGRYSVVEFSQKNWIPAFTGMTPMSYLFILNRNYLTGNW
jgi:hypothetical protein